MAEIPSAVLVEQVQKIRVRRGWSQQELAERLQALGLPMGRTMLAKLENGKRGVSVDEALTLAVALGVSPSALLLPRNDRGRVSITPGKDVGTWDALLWFRGALPLADTLYPAGSTELLSQNRHPSSEGIDLISSEHRAELIDGIRTFLEEVPDSEAESTSRYPILRTIWVKAGIAMRCAAHPDDIRDLVQTLEDLQADVTSELRRARRELADIEMTTGEET